MSVEDGDRRSWVVAVTTSMTALATLMAGLRILSRWERQQKLWWDDYMIIFSAVWNFALAGTIYACVSLGLGTHASTLSDQNLIAISKLFIATQIVYVYNLAWTKLALLLMYYRIFNFGYFKRWAFWIGTFVILWAIIMTFLFCFVCVPLAKAWNHEIEGHCINQGAERIANAVSTIASDMVILALPIPTIWRLQLHRREKIALTIVFSLGFFVCFTSIYRSTVLITKKTDDLTWSATDVIAWSSIEVSTGIVSVCLPTVKPALNFFARHTGLSKIFSSVSKSASVSVHGSSRRSGQTGSRSRHSTKTSRVVINHQKGDSWQMDDDEQTSGHPATLRPEHGHSHFVVLTSNNDVEQDSLSGDEVPLRQIKIQRDFVVSDA